MNMKNFSTRALLRMAANGSHIPNCPETIGSLPGYECLCWKHEVKKWNIRDRLAASNRIHKPRPGKIHLNNHKCSSQKSNNSSSTSDTTSVTCKQCLRFINSPIKINNKRKNLLPAIPTQIISIVQ